MGVTYRADIDGLRALAVGGVIIYHMKLEFGGMSLFPGGYLGVDIFFVLSGFLITSILLQELEETGRISLQKFYTRRAKRILPPLFLVVLVCIPVAWTLLLPSELERFSASIWAALVFFSNGFWYLEQGEYGAQSALLQPLLHTWSLAIEEQFYLIFPLLLASIYRFRVGLIMSCLVLASLIVSETTTHYKENLSFFSPFSRAWELLAGCFLAWRMRIDSGRKGRRVLASLVSLLSLSTLVLAMIFMPLTEVDHPGIITIPVIASTCGIIWFSSSEHPATKILSMRAFVFFGKLSYSLYLWHFPVFAFGRLYFGELDAVGVIGLTFLTIVLSTLGYYLVEQPFRFRMPARIFFGSTLGALCFLGFFSLAVQFFEAVPSRFKSERSLYVDYDFDNERLRDETWGILDGLSSAPPLGSQRAGKASRHEREDLWFSESENFRILFVGNSHSKDIFNAIYLNKSLLPDVEIARYALGGALIRDVGELISSPNFRSADVVVFSHRFEATALSELPSSIEAIQAAGKPVALIGSADEFPLQGGRSLFDRVLQRASSTDQVAHMNYLAFDGRSINSFEGKLENIAASLGALFLSRDGIVCSKRAGICTLVTSEGRKTMYDDNHWTLEGARLFGRRMIESGWIDQFRELKAAPPIFGKQKNERPGALK